MLIKRVTAVVLVQQYHNQRMRLVVFVVVLVVVACRVSHRAVLVGFEGALPAIDLQRGFGDHSNCEGNIATQ